MRGAARDRSASPREQPAFQRQTLVQAPADRDRRTRLPTVCGGGGQQGQGRAAEESPGPGAGGGGRHRFTSIRGGSGSGSGASAPPSPPLIQWRGRPGGPLSSIAIAAACDPLRGLGRTPALGCGGAQRPEPPVNRQTRGPNSSDSNATWKLKSTIRDLEERRMREIEEHQLGVATLLSVHQEKLADVGDRHHKQLLEYAKRIEDLQDQYSAGHGKDDLLQERETELRRLKQQLAEMERLNDNLNNVASDLRAENQKLVLALQDVRHQLEESIRRNNEDSLENNTAVRALKREKGRLIAKLSRVEKKLLEEMNKYEQTIKEWSPLEHVHFIQHSQEKDLEIVHLKKRIEQMDADHKGTKEMLSSALEEQKRLTQLIKEKEMYIEERTGSPELQEEFGQSTQTFRGNDIFQPSVEDKDRCLPSVTDENHHLREELESPRQQSHSVPAVDPKILDKIIELECEVFQLQELKDDLRGKSESNRRSFTTSSRGR
ncbi:thyroid receptor-interacting protein 11-like [Zalophus californianus]|uniref:Thyroid receptor-interacting protein 11-like n=1 Tax=Zalophus californianus TaxID=9704 RepID=A0A6P9FC42_ZALCA|nr:thyroid receptor-interacting protein 11-like [Zalophus californianus]